MQNKLQTTTGLVLGGSGFLGAWVVEEALAAGGRVLSVSRAPGERPRLGHETHTCTERTLGLDVLESAGLRALLKSEPLQWIVNCVALARAADCEADVQRARALNTAMPMELSALCVEHDIPLVHISTDLVFDGAPPRESGYVETDVARPLGVYGETKLEGERGVLRVNPTALVVRLPLLCGDSGGRGLGASDSLRAALERGETARLFGDEFRTPLDVRLAARALLELAHGDAAGLLHVAGPERLSRFELGELSLRPTDDVGKLQLTRSADLDLHPPRPADVSLDCGRARRILGLSLLSPRITLAEGTDSGPMP